MDNIFIQKSIVMGIGAMTEDDLDLSDSSSIYVNLMAPIENKNNFRSSQ